MRSADVLVFMYRAEHTSGIGVLLNFSGETIML